MKIQGRAIGLHEPTYFIADIAANHDGDLSRALDLIWLAAEAGADAVKFQHFRAEEIVSDRGFRELGSKKSHQASWKKSVFEVYKEASLPWNWTGTLAEIASEAGVHFFTSPYDLEAVDYVDEYVPAYKIGSGDITWLEIIERIASKGKPVILATGASNLADVVQASSVIRSAGVPFVLMQCNTNYTGDEDNLKHIHLNVLKTYGRLFPDSVLGLSDHTPGDVTVLGAVALGARVVEKHFTDDSGRDGPDHHFSMTPTSWREMVRRTRLLEAALGKETKEIAENEIETSIVQRRALRFNRPMKAGEIITRNVICVLRPASEGALSPQMLHEILGKKVASDVERHDPVTWKTLV